MKTLVLLGGDAPKELLLGALEGFDFVICADAGAARLDAVGRLPDAVVGDMDSIDAELLERLEDYGVEVIRAEAAKDETDGQLALDEAIRRGATEITLLGALGGRTDHTLGNLMLLVRAEKKGVHAVIWDAGCEVIAATGGCEIRGKTGQTVSILPAGSGVSVRYLDGLRYGTQEPLPLPLDSPVGVSNVLTADTAHIDVEGWVYIVLLSEP